MNVDNELADFDAAGSLAEDCLIGAGSMTSEHASRGPGSL